MLGWTPSPPPPEVTHSVTGISEVAVLDSLEFTLGSITSVTLFYSNVINAMQLNNGVVLGNQGSLQATEFPLNPGDSLWCAPKHARLLVLPRELDYTVVTLLRIQSSSCALQSKRAGVVGLSLRLPRIDLVPRLRGAPERRPQTRGKRSRVRQGCTATACTHSRKLLQTCTWDTGSATSVSLLAGAPGRASPTARSTRCGS